VRGSQEKTCEDGENCGFSAPKILVFCLLRFEEQGKKRNPTQSCFEEEKADEKDEDIEGNEESHARFAWVVG
jgi:hypothetical protein